MNGIHLDLKYVMPRKDRLADWVRQIAAWGIDTILLEYEDAFPYERYPFLRSSGAFTREELTELLDVMRGEGMTVIPLIQLFAHLEFALAHEQLAHLRERPEIHAKLCALNPEAVAFAESLMDEILAMHGPDAIIHLGGDEVWHTQWCPRCQERIDREGPAAHWTAHMAPLLERAIAAGKRPMVWDDIFWKDPEAIHTVPLPKQTILHAWNYNITRLRKDGGEEGGDLEFGGAGGVLGHVDQYRKAGYDVIGCPCLSYGSIFPRVSTSIANTWVWSLKAQQAGLMGVVNSAWSCFHVPLLLQEPLTQVSAALVRDPQVDTAVILDQWAPQTFGASGEGVAAALETLGALFEVPMPEMGRPFTPLPYGYMNMVLHYPGRQKERQQRGGYPLDWKEIDFQQMYRHGVAEVAKADAESAAETGRRLDAILETYPPAVAALKQMAEQAQTRRQDAADVALLASLKLLSARAFSHLLRGDQDGAAIAREREAIRPGLQATLARHYEPIAAGRLQRAYMGGLELV